MKKSKISLFLGTFQLLARAQAGTADTVGKGARESGLLLALHFESASV
jgi:hypothetical protein